MSLPDTPKPAHSRWKAFADVDASGDAGGLARYLDDITSIPGIAAGKQLSLDLLGLHAGSLGLDVGCGNGAEVARMASRVGPTGRVVGLDRSASLIAEAKRRHERADSLIEFVVGDAHALPFRDATFDACRADRTLQHLQHPDAALAEMVRVLRPRGRVVVTESRWGLDAPDLDPHATAAVLGVLSIDPLAQDWLGHFLPMMFQLAGVREVGITNAVNRIDDLAHIMRLMNLQWALKEVVASGKLTTTEAQDWHQHLVQLLASGKACVHMLVTHVRGTKA